jgi:hypothetical protein
MAWKIGRREVPVVLLEDVALAPVRAQLAEIAAAEAALAQQRERLWQELQTTLRAAWAEVRDDEARRDVFVASYYWQWPHLPLGWLADLLGVPANSLSAYAGPRTEPYACPGCGTAHTRVVRSRSEMQGVRVGLKASYGLAVWLLCAACTAAHEAGHEARRASLIVRPAPVAEADEADDDEPWLYG